MSEADSDSAEIIYLDRSPLDTHQLDPPELDPHVAPPQGSPCPSCGAPVEGDDHFCPACGLPVGEVSADRPDDVTTGTAFQRHFRCETCGAEVGADLDSRSFVCPFCDSNYVVEIPETGAGRQRPEFVIGFAVTRDEALAKFRTWIRQNSWYRPGDLARAGVEEKLRGVYLPFWSFSMLAHSQWAAEIGEYWYRTETYTTINSKGKPEVRTRQVRETEWWPLLGRHHRYYSGFLVSGSQGLPQGDAERIKPFQLPALKRYEPRYLAGWLSEEYSIQREAALEVCQAEFARREQGNVAAFLPGDTSRGLRVRTDFAHVNSDLCLLPVYILSYRYGETVYRFLVNGQTGRHDGDKPVSWKRIGGVTAVGVILVILAILLILLLSNAFH